MSCSTWRFAGSCATPKMLDQQVRRMLADPRARTALVQNFFSQWLQVRNVWLLTPDANRSFRGSTTTCAPRSSRRRSCSSKASCERTAASSSC